MNDVIIRHDALWPRGLNELLYVQTPLEVAELRLSCLRHRWPPAEDHLEPRETQLNLPRLRARLHQQSSSAVVSTTAAKKISEGTPARPTSTSTTQSTVLHKSQQQATRSPTNRGSATTTKPSASSPTKTPRSRPQSAPKPPPSTASTPSRLPQQSTSTPRSRSQAAAKSTASVGVDDGSGTRRGRSTAETESVITSSSVNGASSSHTQQTSTAEPSDFVVNTQQNVPSDSASTSGYQQIPATV